MGGLRIIEHRFGEILRLETAGSYATSIARDLLGFLKAELEAQIEEAGTGPVLIQLEGLEAELSTDGPELAVRRVAGSPDEFEELCALIVNQSYD